MLFLYLILVEVIILSIFSRKVHRLIGRLIYRITRSKKLTVYLTAILFLPGTFVHEMSHFLAALFLLVPVGEVHLTPKIMDTPGESTSEISVILGSVAIAKTDPLRRFLIGAAPLFFGFILIVLAIYFSYSHPAQSEYLNQTILDEILIGYLVFTVANTMFSSKRDLEGSWVLAVALLFLVFFLWVFGTNIHFDLRYFMESININILKSAALFMTIPVMFDIIVITALRKI